MWIPALSLNPSGLLRTQWGYNGHMYGGPGTMMGFGWGAWGVIHAIFWLVILIAIMATLLTFLKRTGNDRNRTQGESGKSALDLLDERYARGEIDREEYLQRKKDISER